MANPRTSNSRLLAIGFAVLVVGVVLVLLIIRNTDDDPAEPSPVATEAAGTEGDVPAEEETPLTSEQLSSARLPLPLDIPEGAEAMAVRVPFDRAVAAIPTPGDLVNLYRHLAPGAEQDEPDDQQDQPGEGDDGAPTGPATSLPPRGPDGELVLPEVEVLAVTGPLPAANDGTVTAVLAIPSEEVAGLMPLANANELWFTLLSDAPEDDATEEPSAPATEES